MGHPQGNTNYSVSEVQITNVASGSSLPSVAKLYITPHVGYVVSASHFVIGGSSAEVTSVNLYDYDSSETDPVVAKSVAVPGTPGNIIEVECNLDPLTVVSSNLDLLVDINGRAIPIGHHFIDICFESIVENNAHCYSSYWPQTGPPISPGTTTVPTGFTQCTTCFMDDEDIASITNTPMGIYNSWTNPLNGVTGYNLPAGSDVGFINKYQGIIQSGSVVTLFKKTFWTGPTISFEVTPFYELNTAASNSNAWIINETPTNYNVDKTLLSSTISSNIVHCDTTDIILGMQVTGSSLVSCSFDPVSNPTPTNICWPLFGSDIRVIDIDHYNNRVYLSEVNDFTTGDILNFSSVAVTDFGGNYLSTPRCLAKEFTIQHNGANNISCDSHVINWGHAANLTPTQIPVANPKITQININNTENMPFDGGSKSVTVRGTKLAATFSITVTRDSDLTTYDFANDEFSAKNNSLKDQVIDSTGLYKTMINFPYSRIDESYTIVVTPTTNDISYLTTVVDSGITTSFTVYQYVAKTLTFTSDATTSGLTLQSTLTNSLTTVGEGGLKTRLKTPTWTGTITKADGSIIYLNRNPLPLTQVSDENLRGDFTINTTSTTDGKTNDVKALLRPTITGAGTATLTATIIGEVLQIPTANTTITFDVDGFVTINPSVPSALPGETSVDLYVPLTGDTEGYLDIDVRAIDTDSNKASKTLSTVTNPKYGTLSAYGASGSAWDNGRIRYTLKSGVVAEPGQTDSFVYKATISAASSDEDGYGTITVQFK
tara:strand:- start:8969 stop:11287 length:2319 start_codon:yes stop_codon:yes gene_type:complete